MSDSPLLQRYLAERDPALGKRAEHTEAGITEDLSAFGWLRGVGDRAIMLELRHKNGNITALSYNTLERVEFNPSDGITLFFGGQKIRVKGRNLNKEVRPQVRLLDGILRHRVPWIREADRSGLLNGDEHETVITAIDWTSDG